MLVVPIRMSIAPILAAAQLLCPPVDLGILVMSPLLPHLLIRKCPHRIRSVDRRMMILTVIAPPYCRHRRRHGPQCHASMVPTVGDSTASFVTQVKGICALKEKIVRTLIVLLSTLSLASANAKEGPYAGTPIVISFTRPPGPHALAECHVFPIRAPVCTPLVGRLSVILGLSA